MSDPPSRSPLALILSGGQVGVDRAALDAALDAGLARGGWCPPGRASAEGPIPAGYDLEETPEERSPAAPEVPRSLRTEWNVRDADAVLVLTSREVPSDPGTAWTMRCARRLGRPLLVCELEDPLASLRIREWIVAQGVRVLNVAGPGRAELQAPAGRLLAAVFASDPDPS